MIDVKKARGTFLNIMLCVYVLLFIARLLSILAPSNYPGIYGNNSTSLIFFFNIFVFIIGAIGLVGIILWKKWSIYFLVVTTLISVVVDLVYFPRQVSIVEHVLTLIPICLLIWSVVRKWALFK
jgi:hypothetical protein